ncbi:MAG: UbiA family prenyltransferase [Solirubrobacteraceae bacterium]
MAVRQFLDERNVRGGRGKALLFLVHPGPSVLVTGVTVAAIALLSRGRVGGGTLVDAALVVLPAQFAIGALNDWADAGADAAAKPHKPITRGMVGRTTALVLAVCGFALSLVVAAVWGWRFLLVDVLGIGSGVAYDLGLKRSPASVLCWWGGLQAVVLLATTASGAGGALLTLPLSGLLALGLHVSNVLPDADGDRATGARTMAVLLGPGRSRAVMVVALGAAAVDAAVSGAFARLGATAMVAAVLILSAAVVAAALPAAVLRARGFPLLACLSGAAAVAWLVALPAAG